MSIENINPVECGTVQEILGINPILYNIVENNYVFLITIIITILTITYSMIKKEHILKTIIVSIICFGLGILSFNILSDMRKTVEINKFNYTINYLLKLIIPIALQLIPFIMCLRNNKNVKKDEVKQENV